MFKSLFSRQQPNAFDWRKSPAHMLLLSKYCNWAPIDAYERSYGWEKALKEPVKAAMQRLLNDGAIEICNQDTSLDVYLERKLTVTQLKDMLKKHGVKISGQKKCELINALIQSDRIGAKQAVKDLILMKYTAIGKALVEQYLSEAKRKEFLVEQQVMVALKSRSFSVALQMVDKYNAEQPFPFIVVFGSTNSPPNPTQKSTVYDSRLELLKALFKFCPRLLSGLNQETLEQLRIRAGLSLIWPDKFQDRWLSGISDSSLKVSEKTAILALDSHARFRADIEYAKRSGIKYATISTCNDWLVCDSCAKLSSRMWKIDEAPELPNIGCTAEDGCRCRLSLKIQRS
jgi:hypothetical protein